MGIQESLFKIAGIFLIAHGMEISIELFASVQSMPPNQNFQIPIALYYGKALPILIGVLVWLISPAMARKMDARDEPISTQSSVSVGCFLLGIYFIGAYLPEILSIYLRYRSLSETGSIGSAFAQDQLPRIQALVAKLVVGVFLILFPVQIGKIFKAIRRFSS